MVRTSVLTLAMIPCENGEANIATAARVTAMRLNAQPDISASCLKTFSGSLQGAHVKSIPTVQVTNAVSGRASSPPCFFTFFSAVIHFASTLQEWAE